MRAATVAVSGLLASLTFFCGAAVGGDKDHCIRFSDMYRGRNCGSGDSVQTDVANDCGIKVKGFVIFYQKSGDPIRTAVNLRVGDHLTAFACTGNGKLGKDFEADK